jgi:hypothetical protein
MMLRISKDEKIDSVAIRTVNVIHSSFRLDEILKKSLGSLNENSLITTSIFHNK